MGFYNFYTRFISLNLKDYSAFGIDLEINKLLIIVMLGIIIGTVIINHKRSLMTLATGKLLRHGAIGEDKALPLTRLGIDTPSVRRLLLGGGQIKSVIGISGREELTYEQYIEKTKDKSYKGEVVDFENCGIYIKQEAVDTATKMAASRSSSPLNTFLFCVLIFASFVCLILLMPEILSTIDKILAK